jgi:hypothetical protein
MNGDGGSTVKVLLKYCCLVDHVGCTVSWAVARWLLPPLIAVIQTQAVDLWKRMELWCVKQSCKVLNTDTTWNIRNYVMRDWLTNELTNQPKQLRWSRGCVLAFSTQVRGFKHGRSRRIFQGEKILSTTSLGGEVKPSVPCCRFAACKRSLK